MKKKILLLMGVFAFGFLQAQVGINTDNPLTDLHIVGNQYITGNTKIGGNSTFNASAQLELGDIDKGFLANRVKLTDSSVKAPVTNAEPGMLVYNTTVDPSKALKEGYYFWNGNDWEAFVTEIPDNPVAAFDLLNTVSSGPTSPSNSELGNYLSIGDKGVVGAKYFNISTPGAYAFGLRVYGNADLATGKTYGRACVYFTLMVDGVKVDVQEVNWALVDPAEAGASNKLGGTVVLTGNNLNPNQKIQFVLSHYNVVWSARVELIANPGLQANKTSLVFWRL